MSTLKFQAKVENGVIVVPEEYKHELAEVSTVKIVVLKQPKKQILQFDIMDELAQKPVPVPLTMLKSPKTDHCFDAR